MSTFPSTEVEIEQTGPLITPAALPALNPQQTQNLAMAKKYCADVTSKFVSCVIILYCPIECIPMFP